MFEDSVRVPFFIAGPNIPRNRDIDSRIYLQDAMPTALELAGAPLPPDLEFQSVLPYLHDKGKPRDAIFQYADGAPDQAKYEDYSPLLRDILSRGLREARTKEDARA